MNDQPLVTVTYQMPISAVRPNDIVEGMVVAYSEPATDSMWVLFLGEDGGHQQSSDWTPRLIMPNDRPVRVTVSAPVGVKVWDPSTGKRL